MYPPGSPEGGNQGCGWAAPLPASPEPLAPGDGLSVMFLLTGKASANAGVIPASLAPILA